MQETIVRIPDKGLVNAVKMLVEQVTAFETGAPRQRMFDYRAQSVRHPNCPKQPGSACEAVREDREVGRRRCGSGASWGVSGAKRSFAVGEHAGEALAISTRRMRPPQTGTRW